MKKHHAVSVIIPVYNGERYLAESIQSVLAQTFQPAEIIVVDDGSIDTTAQIVANLADAASVPIRYVYQTNQGPASARNRGLELSIGEFIAFQDADDLWSHDKLSLQMALFDPLLSVVLGYTRLVLKTSNGIVPPKGPWAEPGLVTLLQAGLFRYDVFERIGLFDESLRCGEDLDWYLRALEKDVKILTHTDTVVFYRRHGSNLTCDWDMGQQILIAIKRSLVRRRQFSGQEVGVFLAKFRKLRNPMHNGVL